MQSLNKIQLKSLVLTTSFLITMKGRFSQFLFIVLATILVIWSNELVAQNQNEANCPIRNTVPSIGSNYILTTIPRVSNFSFNVNNNICDATQNIQYFDGLGRRIQNVDVKASPTFNDVVQPYQYDQYDRETIKYLPYSTVSGTSGAYQTNALSSPTGYTGSMQYQFYTQVQQDHVTTTFPYAPVKYEASSQQRVLENGAPGQSWQLSASVVPNSGHTVKSEYKTNDQGSFDPSIIVNNPGSKKVALYGVEINPSTQNNLIRISNSATYASNKLTVLITKDENWNPNDGCIGTKEEYKDMQGRVVLVRTYNLKSGAVEMLSTYYVYDELGNLCFVLPPGTNPDADQLITQTTLDQFAYQYHYDRRNRLNKKNVPGYGWTAMFYDHLDHLIMEQDFNQRNRAPQEVTAHFYDQFGKEILSFIAKVPGTGANGSTMATTAEDYAIVEALIDSQPRTWEIRDSTTVDGYSGQIPFPYQSLTVSYYDNYKGIPGLPTNFVAPLGASKFTNRLLVASKNTVLNTIDNAQPDKLWTVNYYDEKGRILRTYKQHYLGGVVSTSNYDVTDNVYNFSDQLVSTTRKHYTSVNTSDPTVTILNTYVYDHVGRPYQSFETINDGTPVLLSQNDYNEVGQLHVKHLHKPLGEESFGQDIQYSYNERGWLKSQVSSLFAMQLNYDFGNAPQYNGNISSQSWGVPTSLSNSSIYRYDRLNRLTQSVSPNLGEAIAYDVSGNITRLTRDGFGTNIYNGYNGNQLSSIQGFTNSSYTYDNNGNLKTDSEKGISIQYNYLNLPIGISGNENLSYVYDATGAKLRKGTGQGYIDYIDGIQYKLNGNIDFIQSADGIARNNSGVYNHEYTLNDHLGNSRVTFYKNPVSGNIEVLKKDDYFAFGLRKKVVASSSDNKYLYNGKELQEEVETYDFGARFYDPVLARWNVVDPLADNMTRFSPYAYGFNNPTRFTDPDGMEPQDWIMGKNKFPYWNSAVTSATDKDLKKGDIYIGKTGEYSTSQGYTVQLNSDQSWNYKMPELAPNAPGPSLAEAVQANMPMLNVAEGIAIGVAIVASGEVGGGEAAGNFLMGQAARKSEFLGGLSDYVASRAASFFEGASYTQKVSRQMGKVDDIVHAFPNSVDGFASKFGQWSTKVGGDGNPYQWLRMQGNYQGKAGVFEYTKDANGLINHRYFNIH